MLSTFGVSATKSAYTNGVDILVVSSGEDADNGSIPLHSTTFVDERHLTLARVSGREPPNDGHEVQFPTGIYNTFLLAPNQ